MPLNIETIQVEYTYNKQQILNKIKSTKYLSGSYTELDKKYKDTQKVMVREISQIYIEAYRSVIPIKGDKYFVIDRLNSTKDDKKYKAVPRLTPSQKQRAIGAFDRGTSFSKILSALLQNTGPSYGGTLRNQHLGIRFDSTQGTISVDDALHATPYNEGNAGSKIKASSVAADLNAGVITRKKPISPSSPVGGFRATSGMYKRSRASDAQPGFISLPAGSPTAGWIRQGHEQAQRVIKEYLASVESSSANISARPPELDKSGQPKASLKDYITKGNVPTIKEQTATKKAFFSEALNNIAKKRGYGSYEEGAIDSTARHGRTAASLERNSLRFNLGMLIRVRLERIRASGEFAELPEIGKARREAYERAQALTEYNNLQSYKEVYGIGDTGSTAGDLFNK